LTSTVKLRAADGDAIRAEQERRHARRDQLLDAQAVAALARVERHQDRGERGDQQSGIGGVGRSAMMMIADIGTGYP